MAPHVPTSLVLQQLLDDAPADHMTLASLMDGLRERSFGIVMLVLGLIGLAPGVSAIASVMLAILAFQMILARPSLVFPRFVASRKVPTARVMRLGRRAVSTFRAAAELAGLHATVGFDALAHALLSEAALDSGLTPSEVKRQIDCGLAHGRRQQEGGSA